MKQRSFGWKVMAVLVITGSAGCAPGALRGGSAGGAAATVAVGVASVDITPGEPIRLTGYGNRREPTAEVAQRLHARALAIGDDARGPAVLITADLIAVPRHVTERVARRLEREGIQRAQVVVTATHTHTGPSLTGVLPYIFGEPVPPEQQAAVDRYTEQLVARLEGVALAALRDRQPALLAWGQGSAGFAANRRVLQDGRWTGFGVNPEGPVDHDLPVLTARSPDGTLRAVLLSYAAHCTTLEGRHNFIHGDWAGAAREIIEQRHPGAVAMVMIGTGADANPEPRGGGLPDVERNGREIADEVERLLGTPLRPLTVVPRGRFRQILLPFEHQPSRAEWEQRARQPGAAGLYARATLERLDRGERIAMAAPYPVQTWTWGDDLAMVFLGGEVVVDYGLRLKRELDASRLWVSAYANDVSFYVPSRRVIEEGGYEVEGSMLYYGHPSRFAEATEDLIVHTVRDLLPPGFAVPPADTAGRYELVWADEFEADGRPDPRNWTYETGFVRNEELQWYQPENARVEDGLLVIEGRRERLPNPGHEPGSDNWRRSRPHAEYTSASLTTRGLHSWRFGRFEMRARIDARPGLWPAFWTLGVKGPWPANGEIDIMEYYRGMLLANVAWADERRRAVWDDLHLPVEAFGDPEWAERFHVWRMDWDADEIRLYVDDILLNSTRLSETRNRDAEGRNPFLQPHYIILNLAIGGMNGGDPSATEFPSRYEVDYVRVYREAPRN